MRIRVWYANNNTHNLRNLEKTMRQLLQFLYNYRGLMWSRNELAVLINILMCMRTRVLLGLIVCEFVTSAH
jgi:hypothetical protein